MLVRTISTMYLYLLLAKVLNISSPDPFVSDSKLTYLHETNDLYKTAQFTLDLVEEEGWRRPEVTFGARLSIFRTILYCTRSLTHLSQNLRQKIATILAS